ncbi:hypothetical protein [Sphingomonas sp. PB4P5]|uniref:hypothetical protein n=1 Tax=Parasphingomonas puruogangriensis TaxID=3096155 RepID=UPI002FC90D82
MSGKTVLTETRDASWAAPAERSIALSLQTVPYIDVSKIAVVCAFSICEAHGQTLPNTSSYNLSVTQEYLKKGDLATPLANANAFPQAAEVRENSNGISFTLKLDRLHR